MFSLQPWVKEGHRFESLTQVAGGTAVATSFLFILASHFPLDVRASVEFLESHKANYLTYSWGKSWGSFVFVHFD